MITLITFEGPNEQRDDLAFHDGDIVDVKIGSKLYRGEIDRASEMNSGKIEYGVEFFDCPLGYSEYPADEITLIERVATADVSAVEATREMTIVEQLAYLGYTPAELTVNTYLYWDMEGDLWGIEKPRYAEVEDLWESMGYVISHGYLNEMKSELRKHLERIHA